jgi:hypothetical protein
LTARNGEEQLSRREFHPGAKAVFRIANVTSPALPMKFEVVAEAVLAQADGSLLPASPPEVFGFIIITIGNESFSSAVLPEGSSHLVPGEPSQVRLRFLTPEVAAEHVRPGAQFSFFEQYRVGEGHVLTVNYA